MGYLKKGVSNNEAHKNAFIEEQIYISRFLDLEQQKSFQTIIRDLMIN